ncbi:hypothetical protein [Streptomyces marincola]|uniref:hypothetical protein n=1 Tax=Streptomyces marincola TaxID=2878388 RepID=UPI001CF19905|nr:hypothetical protein [Streptomyces marincola]UCM89582.1 hypothetical protein LC193_17430 [Streptomyces marincola]
MSAVAVAAAAALIAGATGPATGATGAASPATGATRLATGGASPAAGAAAVTLITGDRVTLDAAGDVTGVRHAPGREAVPLHVLDTGTTTHVVPADALPLLHAGTLDRRLFDTARLARAQAHGSGRLPLVLSWDDGRSRPLGLPAGTSSDAGDGEAVAVPVPGTDDLWTALTEPASGTHALTAAPGLARIALGGDGDAGGEAVRPEPPAHRAARSLTLSVKATDRTGAPAADWHALVTDLATMEVHYLSGPEGGASLSLPPGEYAVETTVSLRNAAGEVTGVDWLVRPTLSLTEDTAVRADAATAEEIVMTVPDDAAEPRELLVGWTLDGPAGTSSSAQGVGRLPDGFRTAQLGPPATDRRVSSAAHAVWEAEGTEYHSADLRAGSFYTGLTDHPGPDMFTTVTVEEGSSLPGRTGRLSALFSGTGWAMFTGEHALPRTGKVLLDAEEGQWRQQFEQFTPGRPDILAGGISEWTAHEPGGGSTATFNVGVFGPVRDGDRLSGRINPFSDGGGHIGHSVHASGRTTLYRDGEEFATEDEHLDGVRFLLPPEKAGYELVTTVSRGADEAARAASVSTEITASFAFTSAAPAAGQSGAIPVNMVRFSPKLAPDSTSPAGTTVTVPVTVRSAGPVGDLASLAVSWSADGGETWTGVPVEDGAVRIPNPEAGGTVSLRAEVEDTAGNATGLDIIDAYRTA